MPKRIEERLRIAMGGKSSMPYHDMMDAVFPIDDFPNAWRAATKGGPPGCARSFGSSLNRYGYTTNGKNGYARIVFAPVNKKSQEQCHAKIDLKALNRCVMDLLLWPLRCWWMGVQHRSWRRYISSGKKRDWWLYRLSFFSWPFVKDRNKS